MFLYPVFSALPQEFIYRRFFFARYADLFTEKELVFLSALLFGIMHIVFGHWFSVVLSTIGGFLFARTYLFSRSLLITTFEHSLYGIVIFTFGFDSYFYDGPALP